MIIIIFGQPVTNPYATLRQNVAGNSGIVFCNLGTTEQLKSYLPSGGNKNNPSVGFQRRNSTFFLGGVGELPPPPAALNR